MQSMVYHDLFGITTFPLIYPDQNLEWIKSQRLNLIIKGNEFLATAHAAVRGIPIEVTRVLHDPTPHTSAKCSVSFEREVQAWYQEDAGCDFSQTGALVGSLLYYGTYVGKAEAYHRGEKLPD